MNRGSAWFALHAAFGQHPPPTELVDWGTVVSTVVGAVIAILVAGPLARIVEFDLRRREILSLHANNLEASIRRSVVLWESYTTDASRQAWRSLVREAGQMGRDITTMINLSNSVDKKIIGDERALLARFNVLKKALTDTHPRGQDLATSPLEARVAEKERMAEAITGELRKIRFRIYAPRFRRS